MVGYLAYSSMSLLSQRASHSRSDNVASAMVFFGGGGWRRRYLSTRKAISVYRQVKAPISQTSLGLSLWSTSLRSKSISMGGQCEPILVGGLTYMGVWVELYRMEKKAI